MKKNFLIVSGLAFALSGTLSGCSNEDLVKPAHDDNSHAVNMFLNSDYGVRTLQSHGLSVNSLDLENSTEEVFGSKGTVSISVPIVENGERVGRLSAFVSQDESDYRSIVEKWEKTSQHDYTVTLSTGYGAYLATVEVTSDGKRQTQRITEVASETPYGSRAKQEQKESWWECTVNLYDTAKDACNGDSQCDFLCDLANLVNGCTISMAAAAAIVCL